jgi:hypothetical protein
MKIDSNPSNSDTFRQSNIPHSLETFDHDPQTPCLAALDNKNNNPKQYNQTAAYTMLAGVKKTAAGGAA